MKPLYDLIHEKVKFRYIEKVQTLFRQIEKPIKNDVTLTLLSTNIPIFFHCSFFLNWYKLCPTPNVQQKKTACYFVQLSSFNN